MRQNLAPFFPLLQWLPAYDRRDLRGDLQAGLTVGVMLIPQSMAYALLAGLPPIYGLYASLVPLCVYPLLGTSRQLAVGTIAIDMLIVGAALHPLAAPQSPAYIELAILLALMVGTLQILMGLARMGFLVNLLSRPVITGFTSAAALIIGFSQLEYLLGLPLPRTSYVHLLLWEAVQHLGDVQLLPLALGGAAIGLLLGLQHWRPTLPAQLVAVVFGIAAAWGLHLDARGLDIVGAIPTGLPSFAVPTAGPATFRTLLPTAITLALVQFMNIISLGKVFAARNRYTIRPSQELLAVGAANVLGSLFRSMPVSGSFSRTAVNAQAGARTPLANGVAALLIVLTLLFLTPLFYYLPTAVLAAIIMVAAFGLLNLREMRYLYRTKRIDGGIALFTFTVTLLVGIQEGILLGIGASVVALMYRISRPNVAILGHLPGTRSFRDVRRHREAASLPGILMIRIDASFSFANAEYLRDMILEEIRQTHETPTAVVLDASSINDLDTTAVGILGTVAEVLAERGVALYFGGVKTPVLHVMQRSGFYDQLGADHFFLSPHRAVKHIMDARGDVDGYLTAVSP